VITPIGDKSYKYHSTELGRKLHKLLLDQIYGKLVINATPR
jgi:hypothetical protein